LQVKTMNGAANSGRMMAVGHQPCSSRMSAASVWRCANLAEDLSLGEIDREVVLVRGVRQLGLVDADQPLGDGDPKNEIASRSARRLMRVMTAASEPGFFAAACSSAKSACCRDSSACMTGKESMSD
jgi:hypothetical protein